MGMENRGFLKNLTNTACAIGIILSLNTSDTRLIDGNMGQITRNSHSSYNTSIFPDFSAEYKSGNNYKQPHISALEQEANSLFGQMRDATQQEQDGIDEYISSIAEDTGVNFFDIC
jgi:hypothetical protein